MNCCWTRRTRFGLLSPHDFAQSFAGVRAIALVTALQCILCRLHDFCYQLFWQASKERLRRVQKGLRQIFQRWYISCADAVHILCTCNPLCIGLAKQLPHPCHGPRHSSNIAHYSRHARETGWGYICDVRIGNCRHSIGGNMFWRSLLPLFLWPRQPLPRICISRKCIGVHQSH